MEVLQKSYPRANVIVTCHTGGRPSPRTVYTDELNPADLEKFGIRTR